MKKYIPLDALVAEIEKCIYRCNEKKRSCPVNTQIEAICDNKINAYNDVLYFLDTLEVTEVDLEKEVQNYMTLRHLHIKDGGRVVFENNDSPNLMYDICDIANHFFELGMQQSKKRQQQ